MTTYAQDDDTEVNTEPDVDALPKLEHEYAYVAYDPDRPSLTLREIAKAIGKSKITVRRMFDATDDNGEYVNFPNRWQPEGGADNAPFFIPLDDIIAAGLNAKGITMPPPETLGEDVTSDGEATLIDLREGAEKGSQRRMSSNPTVREMQLELENRYLENQLGERERVIASKDEVIQAKDETIRSKNETIEAQNITIRALALPAIEARITPTPPPGSEAQTDPPPEARRRRFRLPRRHRSHAVA